MTTIVSSDVASYEVSDCWGLVISESTLFIGASTIKAGMNASTSYVVSTMIDCLRITFPG